MKGFEKILASLQDGEEITFRCGDQDADGFGVVVEVSATRSTGILQRPLRDMFKRHGAGRSRRYSVSCCFDPDSPREIDLFNEVLRHIGEALRTCRKEVERAE